MPYAKALGRGGHGGGGGHHGGGGGGHHGGGGGGGGGGHHHHGGGHGGGWGGGWGGSPGWGYGYPWWNGGSSDVFLVDDGESELDRELKRLEILERLKKLKGKKGFGSDGDPFGAIDLSDPKTLLIGAAVIGAAWFLLKKKGR